MKELDVKKAFANYTKPEHPVLLISGRIGDEVNIMPAGWVMRSSFDPPIMVVSVGHTRHTHALLKKYDGFILSYPVRGQEDIISYCGSHSGREVEKFSKKNIPRVLSRKLRLPLVEGCRVSFECRKTGEFETGDHTVFAGEVLAASGNPDKLPLLNAGNSVFSEFGLSGEIRPD